MKPGDTVRVKLDDASQHSARDLGFHFKKEKTFIIKYAYAHRAGYWTMTNGYYCNEQFLEVVKAAREPRPHCRGLRLNEFTFKEWEKRVPKLVPRVPELRALHGEPFIRLLVQNAVPSLFKNMVNYAGVEFDSETGLVSKANGQKLKATKWLSNVGVEEIKIQELAKSLDAKIFDLVLSVKYKDLVRASVSRNFTSCWNTSDITELLERPNIAIAGCKDKHGDYLSRWIVWWDDEKKRCVLNPVPYPQKFNFSAAYALTDKVGIWTNYKADGVGEPFDMDKFRTQYLYDEIDKGGSKLKQLSMAPGHKNNENTENASNE